jgi:hypothetical protein
MRCDRKQSHHKQQKLTPSEIGTQIGTRFLAQFQSVRPC